MWHTTLPFWAVFDVALKNMFPSTQLGSVGPWYQDSSLASDGLLSQELASGGRERKSRSLLHHATGRTWVNTQGLAWVDMVDWYFSAAGDLPKSWENLRFTRSMVFRFQRCKAIDSTENLRASHFEPWRKATHKDKDKAPWEDFGSEVLMVFALGQCSSDKLISIEQCSRSWQVEWRVDRMLCLPGVEIEVLSGHFRRVNLVHLWLFCPFDDYRYTMLYISEYFILLLSGQFRLAERTASKRKHMQDVFVDFHL